ncbi:MAG: hypothetical protein ABIL68_02860 [bacterium]
MKKLTISDVLKPVAKAFDELNIPYFIGGSVASTVYGLARTTLDVDLIADLRSHQVTLLVEKIKHDFYIDANMILEAINRRSSFNLIHLKTIFKVDVFILKERDYDRTAFQRRRKESLEQKKNAPQYDVASPEDVIISKLEWYREGGNISERQWNDVLGILKIQKNHLDEDYMRNWCVKLGLEQLLKNALRETE